MIRNESGKAEVGLHFDITELEPTEEETSRRLAGSGIILGARASPT